MENAVGYAVKTCPAIVKTDDVAAAGTTKDPATTTPGAPGVTVWPPMTYAPASLAVKVREPMMMGGSVGPGRRSSVRPPTTTAEASGARLIGVSEIVRAGAPGMRVWLSMM